MSFPELVWDGFETVKVQTKNTTLFVEEFAKALEKFSSISKEYSKGLQSVTKVKLNANVESSLYVSVRTCWNNFIESTEQLGSIIGSLAEDMQKISSAITAQEKERKKPKKLLITQGKKLQEELKKAEAAAQKAKKTFSDLKKKHEESQAEYQTAQREQVASVASKLGKKAESDGKAEEKADKELRKCVEVLRATQEKVWCKEMPSILSSLERSEGEWIDIIKSEMNNAAEAHIRMSSPVQSNGDRLKQSSQAIDKASDLRTFADRASSGRPLALATYQSFMDETGALASAEPKHLSTSSSLNNSGYSSSSSNSYASNTSSSSNNPAPLNLSSSFDRSAPVGANTSSSNLNANKANPNLARAQPTPFGGMLPMNNKMRPKENTKEREKVKAMFDYTATEEGELSFPLGAIITIISQDDSGWWEGEYQGKVGMFPHNFVQPADMATPRKGTTRYRALYDYTSNDPEELSFKVGDYFTLDSESEGWLFVYDKRNAFGRVPSTYTELV
eukprot:TRINITY_DN3994_c0_g1_i1.p1 TRINITY_DN3994_c0_g1~~TRINITY_DN3994_c0_g1_i1.p1  ORF type:complete len:505 (+),score=181.38 TRINITY_DN3994_c0_g1_i1:69-1583(+)